MSRAQEVRKRRLEKRQEDITAEAEKIFDWILDLIDEDTEKGYWGSASLVLFDNQLELKRDSLKGTGYKLAYVLLKCDRMELFTRLKDVIEKEEGYKATIKKDVLCWEAKAICFDVSVN